MAAKHPSRVKEKPASAKNKHGTLSVIKANGRVYISCQDKDGNRRQWVQVSDKEADKVGGDAASFIATILRKITKDTLSKGDAMRIKGQLLRG